MFVDIYACMMVRLRALGASDDAEKCCLLWSVMQSVLCMLAFFTIFWWYGVPLSAVYNMGTQYWMYPDSGRSLSFDCW